MRLTLSVFKPWMAGGYSFFTGVSPFWSSDYAFISVSVLGFGASLEASWPKEKFAYEQEDAYEVIH